MSDVEPPLPASGTPDTTGTPPPSGPDRQAKSLGRKVIGGAIIVVLLVITYFILEAFLPRWWAQQIGQRVDGSFSRGVGTGLTVGFFCTFVPILFLMLAVVFWRRKRNIPAIVCVVLAVVAAIPNLLTLSVVLGGGNGSHAGERIFDVDAPAFRGASLWGAIIGVLVAAAVGHFIWVYRRRGRQLRAAQEPSAPPPPPPVQSS